MNKDMLSAVFLAIVEEGSVSRAADKLGYSQSGLSHILNRAEEELGLRLFERTRSGLLLTTEGSDLLPIFRELQFYSNKLDETIAALRGLEQGLVRIGTYASFSMHLLPAILLGFQKKYPGIRLEVTEGNTDEIQHWIIDRTVDLAFTSIQPEDEFDYIELFEDPFLAIFPESINFEGTSFPIQAFSDYSFIYPRNETDLERELRENHLHFKSTLSSLDYACITSLVRSGLGVSYLPKLSFLTNTHGIRVCSVEPYLYRRIGLGVKSFENASLAAKCLIEFTRSFLPAYMQNHPMFQAFPLRMTPSVAASGSHLNNGG